MGSSLPKFVKGWAALEKGGRLEETELPFPTMGNDDVAIEVAACGVCHSDIHLIDNDWGISRYPLLPGHEIVGTVVATGDAVQSLRIGDAVGVGWQRSSCGRCDDCITGRENLCEERTATCVAHPGGYADYHVTKAAFAFRLPGNKIDPKLSPLLCGGATVFSPLIALPRTRTPRVGVVAIGGLGHLALRFGAAMGYNMTAFTSSKSKTEELKKLGADQVLSSVDPSDFAAAKRSLDLLLVTANVDLKWSPFLQTLRSDGTMCFVGVPPSPMQLGIGEILSKQLKVTGSSIGSRHVIHQMLDFAAHSGVVADTETFPLAKANEALDRVRENKVRYRAVLTR